MKHLKQGIAAFLAALLIMPTLPAAAEETAKTAGSEADQVWFNTGKLAVSVIDPSVSENEAYQSQWMDLFAEDGSYTINIPEENPFFPYEVQFTCNGETTNEWFMDPEDTVEVGGHTFHVSAYMDGTAVTQLSMNVAGKEVVVYPEEKEFTNDPAAAIAPLSITYNLSTQYLTVDLTGFTPVELTQVKIENLLAGSNAQVDTSKIAWTLGYGDDYTISQKGTILDLSNGTSYGNSMTATMIVGEANQLAKDDKKYQISVKRTTSGNWLTAEMYREDASGNRSAVNVGRNRYYDSYSDKSKRELDVYYERTPDSANYSYYLGLKVNPGVFAAPQYASLKAYAGKIADPAQVVTATDITAQLFAGDMNAAKAGYLVARYDNDITLVSYDAAGNVTGCLPMTMDVYGSDTSFFVNSLYDTASRSYISYKSSTSYDRNTGVWKYVSTLYKEYPANGVYSARLYCSSMGTTDNSKVTAAYVGNYNSIAEAQAAGAVDIKDTLFSDSYDDGYQADFSQGVVFSCFAGQDGDENQIVEKYMIQTVNGTNSKNQSTSSDAEYVLSSNTAVRFTGLNNADGSRIPAYTVSSGSDTYGEYNYHVMMVAPGTDLSNVAPTFSLDSTIKLYAAGSSSPEVSGKSYHDLSSGLLQYTASAEDGKASKNYWLKVIQATNDEYPLFVNSLTDESAKTEYKDGVIYSTREMMIDSYHSNRHDIFLANIGAADLQNIKAELESDTLKIGDYWDLDGTHDLSGYATTSASDHNNVAKLRIVAKDGVEAGTEVSGKLTISAAGKTLMVLTLTGTIGDPAIVTKEIPAAVKYVPYGTMIQNSNKYSWNQVSYRLYSGDLPEGMEIKSNGEIYGVPKETGSFTFTVRMQNSGRFNYSTSEATYTLNVLENTDENVENATDEGYGLKERIQKIYMGSMSKMSDERYNYLVSHRQRMVSEGQYSEYVAVYLDGEKLVEGKDYTSEAGSTRITLTYQTLVTRGNWRNDVRTIAIEFRETGSNTLKRAAQNYEVSDKKGENVSIEDSENGSDSGSNSDSGSSSDSDSAVVTAGTIRTITYTVQPGDTLSKIAKKYLGKASLWRKIYEDNKATIKNPNVIRVGQNLVINLPGTATAVSTTAAVSTNANTYVVQPRDNLWKIAKKVYGQGFAWRKIFDANSNTVSNPGNIHVGQVLLIP